MKYLLKLLLSVVLFCLLFASSLLAAPVLAAGSLWNGTWTLDADRSMAGAKDYAANGYHFFIQKDGQIRWEIPSLKEVVTGKVNGQPMVIRRAQATPRLTLSVRPDGLTVLRYQVV